MVYLEWVVEPFVLVMVAVVAAGGVEVKVFLAVENFLYSVD